MSELGGDPQPVRQTGVTSTGKKRLSPALAAIATRSLMVDPREVDVYVPIELDIQIAEAMLAGNVTFRAIAQCIQEDHGLEINYQSVSKQMRDPIAAAWISRINHHNVQHRLGLVDIAVMQRAMSGDMRAADLIYKRFDQIVARSISVHVNGVDFAAMADEDLDLMLKDAQKRGQVPIDVECRELPNTGELGATRHDSGGPVSPGQPRDSAPGAETPESGGAPAVPPPGEAAPAELPDVG